MESRTETNDKNIASTSSKKETLLNERANEILYKTSSASLENKLEADDEDNGFSLHPNKDVEEEETTQKTLVLEECDEINNPESASKESICEDEHSASNEAQESNTNKIHLLEKEVEGIDKAEITEECNCTNLINEEKKQTSILKKISSQIGSGLRKFKRTWLTFTALGVVIAAIQLWRDYTSPSIAEEFQVLFEKNKLAEQYQLPDSMYQLQEVKELHVMQIELENAYALMTFYPEKIDVLVDYKEIKFPKDAQDYIKNVSDLHTYMSKCKNIFINCIFKGKNLRERLENKESNAVLPFSEALLDNVLQSVNDYANIDSLLAETTLALHSNIMVGDSLNKDYISIIGKYSKQSRKLYKSPAVKGYFSSILSLLKTINMMVNVRLREIEIEVINDTYEADADPRKQLIDLLKSLGVDNIDS